MGIIDEFFARAAGRRRQADLSQSPDVRRPPEPSAGFDEFGAPEGGFGRLEVFAGEVRATHVAATVRVWA